MTNRPDLPADTSHPESNTEQPDQTERLLSICCANYLARSRAELLAQTVSEINQKRKLLGNRENVLDGHMQELETYRSYLRALLRKRNAEQQQELESRHSLENEIQAHSQLLEESEVRYRNLIEQSSDLLWETDADGLYTYIGPNCQEVFGCGPQSLIGKPLFDQVRFSELGKGREVFKEMTERRAPFRKIVLRLSADNERELIMEVSGNPIFGAEGEFKGYLGIGHDISERFYYQELLERRVAERTEKLSESETRLIEAQKIARMGNWEFDFVRDRLSWSDEVYRILETDEEIFEISLEAYFKRVHPEDRESVEQCVTRALKRDGTFDMVHRILMPDGQLKFVRAVGMTDFDDESRPLRSYGAVQDITSQKIAERERQEHMSALTRFERLAVGREKRMIELKKEVNDLLAGMGMPAKYRIAE